MKVRTQKAQKYARTRHQMRGAWWYDAWRREFYNTAAASKPQPNAEIERLIEELFPTRNLALAELVEQT